MEIHKPPFIAPTLHLIMGLLKPLEDEVPELMVRSKIDDTVTFPLVHPMIAPGAWVSDAFHGRDQGFCRRHSVDVDVFCEGINADTAADAISQMVRVQLLGSINKMVIGPTGLHLGHLGYVRLSGPPRRVTDWVTSTGMNQYANLPRGATRFQATYGVVHWPSRKHPLTQADMTALASL